MTLGPGGFHQYSGLLGVLGVPAQGYVRVERVEGRAPFYAYGVINDQANSDGSFVFPVEASWLEGTAGQTLPVIVETSEFRSELTVTNFSDAARTLDFQFVAEGIETTGNAAGFSMRLEASEQQIIPDVVDELRRQGETGLGSTRGFYAGPLFAVAEDGDMSGIVIGARTGSQGGGGQYSVFYNAVPFGEAFSREAWVEGLQQNEENREQSGAGQHRGGGRERQRLSSGDLRRGDGIAGRDGGDQAEPGPALASDQRGSWAATPRKHGRVISASRRFPGRTPSWPTGCVNDGGGSGRAQRRRSLPAGEGVGDQQRSVTGS